MHDSGKRQILMLIVDAVAVEDAEIFDDVPLLEGTAPPADLPVVLHGILRDRVPTTRPGP